MNAHDAGVRPPPAWGSIGLACGFALLLLTLETGQAQIRPAPSSNASPVIVLGVEGTVMISAPGTTVWHRAITSNVLAVGTQVRVLDRSRLFLQLSDHSTMPIAGSAEFRIEADPSTRTRTSFTLLKGLLYLFHRDQPADARFKTRTATAAVRGTEFVLEAQESGRTILTVLEGEVDLSSADGTSIPLKSGERGVVEAGGPPTKTAVLDATNVIQWCLYYPAVLDLEELRFTDEERAGLSESLAAYQSGDLLQALARYPEARPPASLSEKVYLSALLLAVGQVPEAEALLDSLTPGGEARGAAGQAGSVAYVQTMELAHALRTLIAAVKGQPVPPGPTATLASSLLADSYHDQAQSKLKEALRAARQASEKFPGFAFAWVRVGELEFSFGHVGRAREALEKALRLAPRHAQALALKGFVLSAGNRITEAWRAFDDAIAIDVALGHAWLGRGLCKIRRGEVEAGRQDIQTAATMEPQRGLLRSYLGKAYYEAGDDERAAKEFRLAQSLDPADPTAWLYSALFHQQHNRLNEAVGDLERSQELNDNRSVYRSRFLLDQDQAVRSANLASVYHEVGLEDVSVREAARAVASDYGNYSAHLFLAGSYARLSDPVQENLRYETPRTSEYLIANLLAPAAAGPLSPTLSLQESSRLFQQDRLGVISSTEYLSRGAWSQSAAQYGVVGNLSYSLEANYLFDPGQRVNNDLEQTAFSLQLKIQLTAKDSLYFQPLYAITKAGDRVHYFDPTNAKAVRVEEKLEPIVLGGYHREWAPGIHSLLLAGHLQGSLSVTNPRQGTLALETGLDGQVDVFPFVVRQDYRSELDIYTAEAQQIFQTERSALILGGRYQTGEFPAENRNVVFEYTNPTGGTLVPGDFTGLNQLIDPEFERLTAYGYLHERLGKSLLLIGGLSYDHLRWPVNFRFAPLLAGEETTDALSPKAGLVWAPTRFTTVRAAYTRSLGGVSFDQSFQLEPAQIAGFNQTFRSLIPESVAGANAAPSFETFGIALDQKFATRTYLGLSFEQLNSKVDRTIGTFANGTNLQKWMPSHQLEKLDFGERTLALTLNQLVGTEWSFGASYRMSMAELNDGFPDLPARSITYGGFAAHRTTESTLHQLSLFALFNHPSGFFAQGQALWNRQNNYADSHALPGDDFWQFNAFAGYRFPRRYAEMRIGLLNITSQDYRLNPLNLTAELPRTRTLALSLKLSF